jgi:uncharacterized membrane protein YkoI
MRKPVPVEVAFVASALAFSVNIRSARAESPEDGSVIGLSAAPAAVQAAIQKAAGSGKVLQVEQETENGQMVYQAELQDTTGNMTVVVVDAAGNVITMPMGEMGDHGLGDGTPIAFSATPAAVQTAIQKAAGTGKVLQVEEESENGQTVYEAEIQDTAGNTTVVVVDAAGNIITAPMGEMGGHGLGDGTPIALSATPAAVQTAIQKAVGTGKVLQVEQETEHGQTVYEAEIQDTAGNTTVVVVDAAGNIITTPMGERGGHGLGDGTPISLSATPAAVQTAIQNAAGTGKVLQVEQETEHGQTVYEAEIQDTAGNTSVVVVDAAGNVLSPAPANSNGPGVGARSHNGRNRGR